MVEAQEKSIGISRVWRVFTSMRVSLVLMFLLAGAAALGVLLPQGTAGQQDILAKLQNFLGIQEIYTTWLFKGLAALLALNTLACLINRLGAALQVFRHPHMRINSFERLKFNDNFSLKIGVQEMSEAVTRNLLSAHYRVMQNTDDDQVLFYGDKHRAAVLGPLLAHLGALILVAGILWSSLSAYSGEVSVIPGGSFFLTKIINKGVTDQVDKDLVVRVNSPSTPSGQLDAQGNLSFLKNGNVLLSGDFGFNTPVTYKDLSIHLLKYVPGIQVSVNYQGNNIPVILTANNMNHTPLPGNSGLVLIWNNVNPLPSRPTLDYALAQGNSLIDQGHLSLGDVANPVDQLTISLEGYVGIDVLRAVRNPAVGLIFGGAAILVLGMFISLYLSYRKVWISLMPEGEQVFVNAGGFGKLKVDFELEFAYLVEGLKGCQEG